MKNDNRKLIKELTQNLQPVEPVKNTWPVIGKWLVIFLLCLGVGMLTPALRPDWLAMLHSPVFAMEVILLTCAALCASIAAYRLAIPDAQANKQLSLLITVPVLIWAGFIGYYINEAMTPKVLSDIAHEPTRMCPFDMLVLSVVPGIFLFFTIKKAAPVRLGLTGMLVFLATASFAAIGSRFLCAMDEPLHLVIWHYVPVLILGLLGIFIGRKLLRW